MQTRTDSFMEALTNTSIGLVISTIANYFVIPYVLGVHMSHAQNIALATIFTVISIARSYLLRRAFDGKSVWQAIKGRFQQFRDPLVTVEAMGITWKLPRSVVQKDLDSGFAVVVA